MKVKTKVQVLLIVLVAIPGISNAQITYGIKAGINGSAMSEIGNLYDGHKYTFGYQVGATLGYPITNVISLGTEFLYQSKGGKNQYLPELDNYETTFHTDYFTIPLYVKFGTPEYWGTNENWKLYGYLGPYYGWLINESTNQDGEVSQDQLAEYTSDTDYGALFGIGVAYNLGRLELYTDLRYEMGLSEVLTYDSDLRNKSIALSVGLNF